MELQPLSNSIAIPKQLLSNPVDEYLKSGLNPIIDSAALLFMLISRIDQLADNNIKQQALAQTAQELKRFELALTQHGYHPQTARYCGYLASKLFDAIELDENYDSISTTDLKQFIENSIQTIDLEILEYIYLCLSNGLELDSLTASHLKAAIFQIIEEHSDQKKLPTLAPTTKQTDKHTITTAISLRTVIILAVVILLTVFSVADFLMSSNSKNTLQQITQLASKQDGTHVKTA